jgi:hypothetical protein
VGLVALVVEMVMRQVTAKMQMLGGPPRNVVYAAIATFAVAERLETDASA